MNWYIIIPLVIIAAVVGVVAVRRGQHALISSEQLLQTIESGDSVLIVDVRTPREFSRGHIPGAILVPHDRLRSSPDEVPRDGAGPTVIYCERGPRARLAQNALIKSGLSNVLHLKGDMSQWRARGLPIEIPKKED